MTIDRCTLRSELPALLGLLALLFVFFLKAASFQGFFFVGDLLQQYYPYLTYSFGRILGDGEWPLWTDQLRLGYPLFAEGQAGLLFPTSLFFLVLPPHAAFTAVVLANVLVGALGMYVFLRSSPVGRAPMPRLAAATGAVVYAYSGRFLVSLSYLSDLRALAAAPWCLWAIGRLLARPSAGRAVVCGLALGLLPLAGKPDTALRLGIALLVVAAYWCLRGDSPRTDSSGPTDSLSSRSALLFGAGLLAMALAAVQWLPTFELLGQSVRSEAMPIARWQAGSLPLAQSLGFLVPHLSGNPYDGTYVGAWNPVDLELYLGPLAALLAAMGLLGKERDRWLWGAIALLGFVLSLGAGLPGYSLLHEIPLLDRMRIPGRWLHLTLLGASVLAAYGSAGLAALGSRGGEENPGAAGGDGGKVFGVEKWVAVVLVLVVVLVFAAFRAFSEAPDRFPEYLKGGTQEVSRESPESSALLVKQRRFGWWQAAGGLLLGVVFLCLSGKSSRMRRCLPAALLVLLLFDQRLYLGDSHPVRPAEVYRPESPTARFLEKQSPGGRFYSLRGHVPAYFLARSRLRRGEEDEALAAFRRHLTANSALLTDLNDAGGYGELDYAGRPQPDLSVSGLKVLSSWGVRHVVAAAEEVPDEAKVAFRSADAAIIEITPMPFLSVSAEPDGRVQVLRRLSFFPGWTAYVAGGRYPVGRCGLFQCVSVPAPGPGPASPSIPEEFRFVYQPLSFRLGLLLSLLGIFSAAALVLAARVSSPRDPVQGNYADCLRNHLA